MTELADALASEQHDARTLIETARRAEAAGFRSVWVSDHYHPWIDRQGHSPFDADMLRQYRDAGGTGPALGALKACWGEDEAKARKLAHELWPTSGIPGQLHQDLPTPAHFEQAAASVTEEAANAGTPCGPDPDRYVAAVHEFVDAGFDEVAITQIGPDQEGFFRFYERELRSRLG